MTGPHYGTSPLDAMLENLLEQATSAETGPPLPVDAGLEVIVRPVPGELIDESHVHGDDTKCVLHLAPVDAREYKDLNDAFVEEVINADSTEDWI